jgi:putative salt-induced outer membrane protein YdiY
MGQWTVKNTLRRTIQAAGVIGVFSAGASASVTMDQAAATLAARTELLGIQPTDKPAPPPDPDSFWDGWKRNAELGLNGSEGNTENLSLRALVGGERKTSQMETRADLGYFYATDQSKKTKSRGEGNLRNDWLFGDSPWGFFAQARLEYDEFQTWQWRASGFLGPSYTFIKDDRTLLRGRAGLGGAYEFGKDADEKFVPEAMLGLDFEHKLSERTKIYATLEYYPSLDEFPDYRLYGKAGIEVLVDPELGMSFRAGVVDRYDASPGEGRKRNDLEYFAALAWTF